MVRARDSTSPAFTALWKRLNAAVFRVSSAVDS
jgi:hypothetical protein